MRLTVVDAFTDRPFTGNPAAVALLDEFPDAERMQSVAREMNLSETAFAVRRADDSYDLRWFTPTVEVDLCGHATLGAAHVVDRSVTFHTRSGPLACGRSGGRIELDFPAWPVSPHPLPFVPTGLEAAVWTGLAGHFWLVELRTADDVVGLRPDLAQVAALGHQALIVTAPAAAGDGHVGGGADIVSRVFGPNVGIAEDPVTGSAHCALAPYWAPRFGRGELVGHQASARGGTVHMRLESDRVVLGGDAVSVSEVTLLV